jgi:hypothetical protein
MSDFGTSSHFNFKHYVSQIFEEDPLGHKVFTLEIHFHAKATVVFF